MDLTTIIHDYLRQDRGDLIHLDIPIHQDARDTRKFRVSDAGRCRLMRTWERQGTPPSREMPAQSLRVMESGNLLHAWLIHVLDRMGVLSIGEQELEDLHRLGHLDAIVEDGNGHTVLYDFKTIASKKAYYMDKDGWQPDKAHVFQVVSYAEMLPEDMRVEDLRIAYVTRDTLEIHEIPVPREVVYEPVLRDWMILIDAWERQTEPAPNPEPWECTYCVYRASCSPT